VDSQVRNKKFLARIGHVSLDAKKSLDKMFEQGQTLLFSMLQSFLLSPAYNHMQLSDTNFTIFFHLKGNVQG